MVIRLLTKMFIYILEITCPIRINQGVNFNSCQDQCSTLQMLIIIIWRPLSYQTILVIMGYICNTNFLDFFSLYVESPPRAPHLTMLYAQPPCFNFFVMVMSSPYYIGMVSLLLFSVFEPLFACPLLTDICFQPSSHFSPEFIDI